MRTNIPQVIFTDEKSDHTVSRTFTIKELQMQLVQARLINEVYTNCNPDKIPWQKTDDYINIKEQWRPCNGDYDKYEASDCGRIRLKGDRILEQHETNYPNTKINDLLQILKDTPDNAKVGYLYVNTDKGTVAVHKLVANAWLKRDPKHPERNTVHHISNDGYNNSPWNLIYLKEEEHLKNSSVDSVHNKTYNDEIKCYHAPLHYIYEKGVIKADGTLLDEPLITLDDGKLSGSGRLKNIKSFPIKDSPNDFVPWLLVANDC